MKPSGSSVLFVGRFLILNSISLIDTGIIHFFLSELWQFVFFKELVYFIYVVKFIYLFFKDLFIYLFMWWCWVFIAACAFSSCGKWVLLFVVVHGLLIAVTSLVVEHGL